MCQTCAVFSLSGIRALSLPSDESNKQSSTLSAFSENSGKIDPRAIPERPERIRFAWPELHGVFASFPLFSMGPA